MIFKCPNCSSNIQIKQKFAYHAGLSDEGFLYCNACPNILIFSSYNKFYEKIVGKKHPWALTKKEKRNVEKHLRPCQCGGYFKFDAFPRCPHCLGDISALLPDKIHFLEISSVLDADKADDLWIL